MIASPVLSTKTIPDFLSFTDSPKGLRSEAITSGRVPMRPPREAENLRMIAIAIVLDLQPLSIGAPALVDRLKLVVVRLVVLLEEFLLVFRVPESHRCFENPHDILV